MTMNFFSVLFFVMIAIHSYGNVCATQKTQADNNQHFLIKAIIFDCDGTLIDNGIAYFLDWQHALQLQGYELNLSEFWDFMNENRLVGAALQNLIKPDQN